MVAPAVIRLKVQKVHSGFGMEDHLGMSGRDEWLRISCSGVDKRPCGSEPMSYQGLGTSAWVPVAPGSRMKATDFRALIILYREGSFLLNPRTMVLEECLRALFTSFLIGIGYGS